MIRAVLVVLCVVLLLPSWATAGDPGAIWKAKYVRVRAYVGPQWLPVVEQAVSDMNAAMPTRGPQLILEPQPVIPCQNARKQNEKKRRVIVVCENPTMHSFGETIVDREQGIMQSPVLLRLGDYPDYTWDVEFNATKARKLVCHELMHAVAGAPENVGKQSCVSGRGYEIVSPGPDDVAFLRRAYRRHR